MFHCVGAVTRLSIDHNFFKRKKSRGEANRDSSAYQHSALPLGHVGSLVFLVLRDKEKATYNWCDPMVKALDSELSGCRFEFRFGQESSQPTPISPKTNPSNACPYPTKTKRRFGVACGCVSLTRAWVEWPTTNLYLHTYNASSLVLVRVWK